MASDRSGTIIGQILRLADGRGLGFAEWGDPQGAPVLYFHGVLSSRLALYRPPAFFAERGIRFITVDRPGVGLSDYQPDRSILDWPKDVVELADALGLDRFGIVTITGGCPYALACAREMPERLIGVSIVSGVAPLQSVGEGAAGAVGRLSRLARTAPWLLARLLDLAVPLLRRRPERVVDRAASSYSEPEREVANRPEVRQAQIEASLEIFRSGPRGEVTELALVSVPWGFRLEDIAMDIHLWDGGQNNLLPPIHARYLADTLPNSRLTVYEGEGHLLIVDHMDEILQAATGQVGTLA